MCGIIGRAFREPAERRPLTPSDLAFLAHRGPDGSGIYTNSHVQFGHTRLAIIDLTDAGRQPMASHDGRCVVTFNGEIYNYLELRAELKALGESFFSHSDTEVLLVAYQRWGRDCVRHFRGMFAFVVWDNAEKTLFLARDRCGEKPLFYRRDDRCLTFASELKALIPLLAERPRLDPAIFDLYLHYQFVPEPLTLLAGIQKVPAAHTLTLSSDNWNAEPQRYWNVEETATFDEMPDETSEILTLIRERLEDAVKMTLRSDVPVAVALSGGIDSSVIAALAQKNYPEPMHAFCVGYPGRPPYDERDQARALAESLNMIVHEVELPVESFVDFFPDLVRIMDEPIADIAAFGHFSVPQAARERGIKVLLTGIGGDEIFWGYPWVAEMASANERLYQRPSLRALSRLAASPHAQHVLSTVIRHAPLPAGARRWLETLKEIAATRSPDDQLSFYMAVPDFANARGFAASVYGPAMRSLARGNAFRPTAVGERSFDHIPAAVIRMLFDTWLVSNCLSLSDRVSMAVSVESRLPFLDVRLIELVMALRSRHPDHHLGQKAWLRAALKGVLPDEVLGRPKAGFQPPAHEWASGVVTKYGSLLRDGQLVRDGFLSREKIDNVLAELPQQGRQRLFFVYKLTLLETWSQEVAAA